MLKIAYARVSKHDGSQSLDLQLDALTAAGVDRERIYTDMASGASTERPGLDACLKALQPGNVLVVWKLDRLGRSLSHLLEIVNRLTAQEIGFQVLTGLPVDTTTSNGRLVFQIFAALAEYERELIRERTLAGLAAAKARGRTGGRPFRLDAKQVRYVLSSSLPARELAELMQCSVPTINRTRRLGREAAEQAQAAD